MRSLKNERGFTLIELVVVLSILCMLTTFAIPHYTEYIERSKEKKCMVDTSVIENAVNMYAADHDNNLPNDLNTLVTSKYLKKLNKDPWSKDYDYDKTTGIVSRQK
jgi:general secretion pathway protein G